MSVSLLELHVRYDAVKSRDKHPYSRVFVSDVYPRYFKPRRTDTITVLEVGVFKGGALQAMRDYFPNGQIVGADITDRVKDHIADWNRIQFFEGDQGDEKFLSMLGQAGPFDFVIEDGSHRYSDQVTSFEVLFPFLSSKGVYFVEDVVPSHNGQYILKYFKDMVTDNRFCTKYIQEVSNISFYQGIIAISKR